MSNRSYFLPIGLWLGGMAAFAIVATMNAVYAAKYGVGDFERNVSVGGAVVIDAACLLLAAAFGMTISLRKWLAALVAFPFLALVVAMSMGTAVGYFGMARLAPAEAARINAERQTKATQLVTDKLSKQADFWQTQVTVGKTADRKLFVEQSRESILTMLKVPTVTAEQAMPDPTAATVARFTGLSETQVQAGFLAILAAVLVMLKVVLVGFGSYLWPRPDEPRSEIDDDQDIDGDKTSAPVSNVIELGDRVAANDRHTNYQKDTVSAWLEHGQSGHAAMGEYKALYDRYSTWCATLGLERVGPRAFGAHLQRLGCGRSRRRDGSVHYRLTASGKSNLAVAA